MADAVPFPVSKSDPLDDFLHYVFDSCGSCLLSAGELELLANHWIGKLSEYREYLADDGQVDTTERADAAEGEAEFARKRLRRIASEMGKVWINRLWRLLRPTE